MKMEALTYHTYDGKPYEAGDTYEADAAYVETLTVLKFAKVCEPKKKAKAAPDDADDDDAKPAKKAKAADDDDDPPKKHK